MRTGYAIRDKRNRAWLATRTLEDSLGGSLTVWVRGEDGALRCVYCETKAESE
jgi:hypothetical protein